MRLKLNEIYLSVNDGVLRDPKLVVFVSALKQSGLRVEALMGEAAWYRPEAHPAMLSMVDDVVTFNAAHPQSKFAAIHLDIEPHQLPENRGKHAFLPALAAAVMRVQLRAAEAGLETSVDLPRFALDEQGPLFVRTEARPFVMLYQLREKTPGWLTKQSRAVLERTYAQTNDGIKSRAVIGLRVQDYPDDLETMFETLDHSPISASRYGGWAVHDEAKVRAHLSK
jgi:hypothetical protein